MKIAILAGDGIGNEIIAQALKVLKALDLGFELTPSEIGGIGVEKYGKPLPDKTLELALSADAVLLGAVGDWKYDTLPRELRPERGLLQIRKALNLFANLRPALLYEELAEASTLKPEVVLGLDILIVRELTGDVYFGEPRGIITNAQGEKEGINTMRYSESEIRRIAHIAFKAAMKRHRKVCSIDKANVLETTEFWRQIVIDVAKAYPDVSLSHMYVDNAAMQLIRQPKQFDVMLTGNIFGDILSDEAAQLTGSIGMLPSASLDENNKGLYEPSHGSAPDIADKNIANPLATILSSAMMLRYTFNDEKNALRIESAVKKALKAGYRTADIMGAGMTKVGCQEMGDIVVSQL